MTVHCDFLFVILYFLLHFSLSILGSNHPGSPLHFSNIDKASNGNLNASEVSHSLYSKYAVGFTLTAPSDGLTIHEIKFAFKTFLSSISGSTQTQVVIFNDHWLESKRSLRLNAAIKDDSNIWVSSEGLRNLVMRNSNLNNEKRFSFTAANSVVIGYFNGNPIIEERVSTKSRNGDDVRSLRYRRAVPECGNRGYCDPSIYSSQSRCQCIYPFGSNVPGHNHKLTITDNTSEVFNIPQAETTNYFHLSFSFLTNDPKGNGIFSTVETATRDATITLYMAKGSPSLNFTTNSVNITPISIPQITNINSWLRIDLILNGSQLIFMLNLCRDETTRTTGCLQKTNTSTPLDFSGGRFIIGRPVEHEAYAINNLGGCVGDVRLNGELQNTTGMNSGCAGESVSCGYNNNQFGHCGENGICYGSILDTAVYRCDCLPGFKHSENNNPKAECSTKLSSYYFDVNSQAKWKEDRDIVYRRRNTFEVQFRTWQKDSHIYSLTDTTDSMMYLKILVEDYVPVVYLNSLQPIIRLNVNVSDGEWHTLRIERIAGILEALVDNKYYEFHYGLFSTEARIDGGSERIVGNNGFRIGIQNRTVDGFQGCMRDVRMLAAWKWMPLYETQDKPSYISTISLDQISQSNCTSSEVCTKRNVVCPSDKNLDVSQWGICICICPSGRYENDSGRCVDICEEAPCVNNGNCTVDLQNPRNRTCYCPSGYEGDDCSTRSVTPAPVILSGNEALPWFAYLFIALAFIMLLAIILFFVFCRNRSKPATRDILDTLDDLEAIHETMGKDCDGAGEEDYPGYIDFGLLRKPTCPPFEEITNPLKQAPPPKDWANPCFDNDEHLDHPLEYGYEGQGSYVSLSSIASGSTDNDLNFDQLRNWGPRFDALSELYKKPDE